MVFETVIEVTVEVKEKEESKPVIVIEWSTFLWERGKRPYQNLDNHNWWSVSISHTAI